MIRAQYHFRQSERGLLAWAVGRLIHLTRELTPRRVELSQIEEIDEDYWYAHDGDAPTCRSLVAHFRLMQDADTDFPTILDSRGRVMDGMHCVCKALLHGDEAISAVQFHQDPEPDYVDRTPDSLPYDL